MATSKRFARFAFLDPDAQASIRPYEKYKPGWWICTYKVQGVTWSCLISPEQRVFRFEDRRLLGQVALSDFESLANAYFDEVESVRKAVDKEAAAKKESEMSTYVFEKSGLPIEALQQDTHWYNRHGKDHVIAEMNPKHAFYASQKVKQAYGMHGVNSKLFKALTSRSKGYAPGT